MTIIEVLDKSSIHNVLTPLSYSADRVVYIGNCRDLLERECKVYGELLEKRGIHASVVPYSVSTDLPDELFGRLEELLSSDNEFIIDIAGGNEILLFLLGKALEVARPEKVQLHTSDDNSRAPHIFGKVYFKPNGNMPYLTVDETVALHGGRIAKCTEFDQKFNSINDHSELQSDIDEMWNICRTNGTEWNRSANVLSLFEQEFRHGHDISVSARNAVKSGKKNAYFRLFDILPKLSEQGLIKISELRHDKISFAYKNRTVHSCLCRAGLLLELKIYLSSLKITDDDGIRHFNDAKTGVVLDWDRTFSDETTINEIDVILMQGMVPIFISCKNGSVDDEELYKLSAVTSRFGGRHAKAVLIASGLSGNKSKDSHLIRRAKGMGIKVVPNINELTSEEIDSVLFRL